MLPMSPQRREDYREKCADLAAHSLRLRATLLNTLHYIVTGKYSLADLRRGITGSTHILAPEEEIPRKCLSMEKAFSDQQPERVIQFVVYSTVIQYLPLF